MISPTEVLDLIRLQATPLKLDVRLCQAIALAETNGRLFLVRYEPSWNYMVTPEVYAKSLQITEATERALQAFSYGPLQIMGSVARELGFNRMLTELNIAETVIQYSLLKMKQICQRYSVLEDRMSAWNSGTLRYVTSGHYLNQAYVDRVLQFYGILKL